MTLSVQFSRTGNEECEAWGKNTYKNQQNAMQLSQKTQYLMVSLSAKNNHYKRNRAGEGRFAKSVSDLKKKCISQSI